MGGDAPREAPLQPHGAAVPARGPNVPNLIFKSSSFCVVLLDYTKVFRGAMRTKYLKGVCWYNY